MVCPRSQNQSERAGPAPSPEFSGLDPLGARAPLQPSAPLAPGFSAELTEGDGSIRAARLAPKESRDGEPSAAAVVSRVSRQGRWAKGKGQRLATAPTRAVLYRGGGCPWVLPTPGGGSRPRALPAELRRGLWFGARFARRACLVSFDAWSPGQDRQGSNYSLLI